LFLLPVRFFETIWPASAADPAQQGV
jgi:hypothetical protein